VEDVPSRDDVVWVNPFIDVSERHWFYDAVRFVHQNNLFQGTSHNVFSPNTPMTRGMMVTVLWRMAGQPSVSGLPNEFRDVAYGTWYSDAVRWAADRGIVSGVGDGRFVPGSSITREQMAVIIYNYLGYMGLELPRVRAGGFLDDDISPWAVRAVSALFEAGVIDGRGGGLFSPLAGSTRAEVAAILMRLYEVVESLVD